MIDINKYITIKRKLIDKALDKYLPSTSLKPQVIHRAMRYSVFPGGKRIRPIFSVAAFEACGGKGNSIIPVASAIELIHSYTLVHDDLPCMDNDDFRRGKKTCHRKFGDDIALLAGDGLLTLAFQIMAGSSNIDSIKEVSKAIGTRGIIGGQVADITGGDIEYINLNKTAVLFEVAAKCGGIIRGAGAKKISALGNFGRDIGLTFQLLDDLKDEDGYAKLYGAGQTKKRAEFLAKRAKSHLKIFGKKGTTLLGLASLISSLR
ncbi:MAG: polyprenyl synthetase family protein [Candidatus Omnitrophota bacterium]|jgi:geranylgeranyl diphosphate synthase type II